MGKIFLPIYRGIVNGTWNKLVKVRLNVREIFRVKFVLFSVIGFQKVCTFHFWWIIGVNAERLDP
jgi:hypothetical protein